MITDYHKKACIIKNIWYNLDCQRDDPLFKTEYDHL